MNLRNMIVFDLQTTQQFICELILSLKIKFRAASAVRLYEIVRGPIGRNGVPNYCIWT